MATIKSFTSLEQSKKVAEILPLESADMCWFEGEPFVESVTRYEEERAEAHRQAGMEMYPCWSLAALSNVASTYCSRLEITLRVDKKYNVFAVKDGFVFRSFDDHPDGFDNLVDACYEMILKLHELNLL